MGLTIEKNSLLGGNPVGRLPLNSQAKEPYSITTYYKTKIQLNLMNGKKKLRQ
jgi:hypothetical protein